MEDVSNAAQQSASQPDADMEDVSNAAQQSASQPDEDMEDVSSAAQHADTDTDMEDAKLAEEPLEIFVKDKPKLAIEGDINAAIGLFVADNDRIPQLVLLTRKDLSLDPISMEVSSCAAEHVPLWDVIDWCPRANPRFPHFESLMQGLIMWPAFFECRSFEKQLDDIWNPREIMHNGTVKIIDPMDYVFVDLVEKVLDRENAERLIPGWKDLRKAFTDCEWRTQNEELVNTIMDAVSFRDEWRAEVTADAHTLSDGTDSRKVCGFRSRNAHTSSLPTGVLRSRTCLQVMEGFTESSVSVKWPETRELHAARTRLVANPRGAQERSRVAQSAECVTSRESRDFGHGEGSNCEEKQLPREIPVAARGVQSECKRHHGVSSNSPPSRMLTETLH